MTGSLSGRTALPSLRSITATLTQAIRFGTPLAESMRRRFDWEALAPRYLEMYHRVARCEPVARARPAAVA